jgi:AcrR family transcriptional regulator
MRTRMKSEQRRAAIVTAAIRLFSQKGFRGTTTRELASAIRVTEPVLYQHFQTKRDLYSAIIEAKAREGHQRTVELMRYAGTNDDRGFFSHLAGLILEKHRRDPSYIRLLLFSALERHELADLFFQRQMVDFHEMVAGYIRKRIRSGAFRKMDPHVATRVFFGMISHHGLVGVLFRDTLVKAGRKKLIDEMVETFLNGAQVAKK